MRLIDADILLDALDNEIVCTNQEREDVINIIVNQHTAYDVDKVVDELISNKYNEPYEAEYQYDYDRAIDEAINIVRRGGINEYP